MLEEKAQNQHEDKEIIEPVDNNKSSKYIQFKPISFILILLFTIIISVFGSNLLFSNSQVDKEEPAKMTTDGESNRLEFEKLYAAFDKIKSEYFQDTDTQLLVDGAINGMFESLGDPYSDYMTKEEAVSFNSTISSSFEGIGAEITSKDGKITVVSPIKGSPAEAAGIRANDVILTVDGTSVTGMSTTEAVLLIRGPKDTKVILTINRPGVEEVITVPIIRDTIPVETVYGELVSDNIGKIQITSFSTDTTNELEKMILSLQAQGMEKLILDLRHNPGGLMNQAIDIVSLFIEKDQTVLFTENREGNKVNYVTSGKKFDMELAVLIDEGSASASEIVAAALSENANIPLIGKTTFGKGVVQQASSFEDGSNVKFTTHKWLTPKQNWINEIGIKPNFEVDLPEYSSLTVINTSDVLKIDTYSSQITTAQQMLNVLGYKVRTDGYFDSAMEQQVRKYQADKGLKVDGILTGETSTKLMDDIRNLIQENDTQLLKAIEVLDK